MPAHRLLVLGISLGCIASLASCAADEQAFTSIIDAYKTQFQQQAVLRVQGEVCANIP